MKQIITTVLLLTAIIGHSQLNSTYTEIQNKFGNENLSASQTDEHRLELKKLNESETIIFTYDSNNTVIKIEVEAQRSIDKRRFHELAKELNPKFKLTSSGNTETNELYYDSNHTLLNIKVYKTNKKLHLTKVIFIADPQMIQELIPEIDTWN